LGFITTFAIEQFFALGDLRDIVALNSTHLIIKNQILGNPNSYQRTNRFRSGMVATTFSTCLPCTSYYGCPQIFYLDTFRTRADFLVPLAVHRNPTGISVFFAIQRQLSVPGKTKRVTYFPVKPGSWNQYTSHRVLP
jgi:hypothetical protein